MNLPYAWRVTKYDPTLRNSQGHYLAEDWTSSSEIGEFFDGKQLTYEDYLSCENAYASSALFFLSEAGLSSLLVSELENHEITNANNLRNISFQLSLLETNSVVDISDLEDVIRLNLREVLWCKQLCTLSRFFEV